MIRFCLLTFLLLVGCATNNPASKASTILAGYVAPGIAPRSLMVLDTPFYFDGSKFISLGERQNILTGVGSATLAAWVKLDSLEGYQDIIAVSIGGGNAKGSSRAALRVENKGTIVAFGRTEDTGNPPPEVRPSKYRIRAGEWVHVCAVFFYERDQIHLYVNGKQVSVEAKDFPFSAKVTPPTLSDTISIGSEDDGSAFYLKGWLKDAGIWDHALSPDRIRNLVRNRPYS